MFGRVENAGSKITKDKRSRRADGSRCHYTALEHGEAQVAQDRKANTGGNPMTSRRVREDCVAELLRG